MDLEGHGREEIVPDVDLSRTVGWFTTIYPVLLDVSEATNAEEMLEAVKQQLRAVPNKGIGYGLLRYMSGDAEVFTSLPQAQVNFNYLGQFDQSVGQSTAFGPAPESTGSPRNAEGQRMHLLEINGSERLDLPDTLAAAAKAQGVRFVLSTDAHHTRELGFMKFAVAVARRAGLEAADILNTRPLNEFLKGLRRSRNR